MGNMETKPSDRTKYGLMFEALGALVDLIEVYDTSLKGTERLVNAVQVFHPNRHQWRQRFYKNIPAFKTRSQRTTDYLVSRQNDFDLIFQVGVLYDARWENRGNPSIIYTDYTAHLSRQKPDSGRSPFTDEESRVWIGLEKAAFEHATHICTRAHYVRDSVVQDYGIDPGKVTAIGGGINFPLLPNLNTRVYHNPKVPAVLFIGKDFYRKGGDVLLKAFAQTRRNHPNARLKMVTSAPPDLNLPLDGVEIIPPIWDRTVIEQLYREASVFVLPSRLETWGDVLLEAMAFGLPCIGVSGEAMGEMIAHEQTGLVVPPQDETALAEAMTRILSDVALQEEWGRAGRQRVEEHFTWSAIMRRVLPIASTFRSAMPSSNV
jgi:alpha-maltose-1-phosphate synthase